MITLKTSTEKNKKNISLYAYINAYGNYTSFALGKQRRKQYIDYLISDENFKVVFENFTSEKH